MKPVLLVCSLFAGTALFSQSYTEGADLPGTGTGPAFNITGSTIVIAGTLNTPSDGQDRFQIVVPAGCMVDSVSYRISDTANISVTGFAQWGMMNQQSIPPRSGSFAAGPWGPFPVGPGTYDCMMVANIAANDSWKMVFKSTCSMGIGDPSSIVVNTYPNPVTGILQVNSAAGLKKLRVYNSTGVLVHEQEADGGFSGIVDCSSFARGIYLLSVEALHGTGNKVFIKE